MPKKTVPPTPEPQPDSVAQLREELSKATAAILRDTSRLLAHHEKTQTALREMASDLGDALIDIHDMREGKMVTRWEAGDD